MSLFGIYYMRSSFVLQWRLKGEGIDERALGHLVMPTVDDVIASTGESALSAVTRVTLTSEVSTDHHSY